MDITESRIIEDHHSLLIELINDKILFYDNNGIIIDINNNFCEMIGYARDEIIGNHVNDFLDENGSQTFQQNVINKKNQKSEYELSFIRKDKTKVYTSVSTTPVYDSDICFKGNLSIITDITGLKNTSNTLEKIKEKLESKTAKIEELNTALNVLIDRNNNQIDLLNLIDTNTKDIIPSSSRSFTFKHPSLTCAEHKILTLIKEGKSSKEISDLLCISERTVDTHRFHIRKKLGISKQGKNLNSYILSIK